MLNCMRYVTMFVLKILINEIIGSYLELFGVLFDRCPTEILP